MTGEERPELALWRRITGAIACSAGWNRTEAEMLMAEYRIEVEKRAWAEALEPPPSEPPVGDAKG
jgi:hypothetical protein